METDRGAILTVQLALRGIVDFSKARVLEVSWWRRINMLVYSMLATNEVEIIKAAYSFQCALVGNGNLTEESFKNAQTQAKETFNDLINTLQPWAAKSGNAAKMAKVEDLISAYKRLIGDPDDPEFKKKIEEEIAQDRARRKASVKESDEARVARLLAERDIARR